jgi:hypothetical protein
LMWASASRHTKCVRQPDIRVRHLILTPARRRSKRDRFRNRERRVAKHFKTKSGLKKSGLKKSALVHSLQKRHVRATPELAPMAIEA